MPEVDTVTRRGENPTPAGSSNRRVALITFHSGEDLIAKTGTRRIAKEGKAKLINKHVIIPTPEEVRRNPASRSAKMRVLEML